METELGDDDPNRVSHHPSPDPEIKREAQSILDSLDFSEPTITQPLPNAQQIEDTSPHGLNGSASKRPLDEADDGRESPSSAAKRVKLEGREPETETSFEDGLALLVQNALSSVEDMSGQLETLPTSFDEQDQLPVAETTETDDAPVQPAPEEHIQRPPTPKPALPTTVFSSDPEKYVREANMRALGHLSISLLLILCQQTPAETIKLLRDFGSPHARSLLQLRVSFEAVRGLYSAKASISADELQIEDEESRKLLSFANLAKLASWLIEGGNKTLGDADKNFMSLFGARLSNLPPSMADLYLAIKTHRCIEALSAKSADRKLDDIVEEIMQTGAGLTTDSSESLENPDSPEHTFKTKLQSRREDVKEQAHRDLTSLKTTYPPEELLQIFTDYLKERLSSETDLAGKLGVCLPASELPSDDIPIDMPVSDEMELDDLSSFFEKTASGLVQNALAGLTEDDQLVMDSSEAGNDIGGDDFSNHMNGESMDSQVGGKSVSLTDYKELEALVAESTSNYVKTTLHGMSPIPYQPTVPGSTADNLISPGGATSQSSFITHHSHPQLQSGYYSYSQDSMAEPPPLEPSIGGHLPPNQTFPSAILYDKARQAALSKTSAHTRREGLHSTRRPWTQEEEKALMAGLDMVKGPHWSQILTLFGQNGTISDILKDRTQVQLKDKARNLKLFFLKTNSEMPYYLQAVTGELKTRAPTQAARKEAEERARLNSEDDQAKLQGIMALAGGLQHHQINRPTGPSPSSNHGTVTPNVVTPAQAASEAARNASLARPPLPNQGPPRTPVTPVRSLPAASVPTPPATSLNNATANPFNTNTTIPPSAATPSQPNTMASALQPSFHIPQALPRPQNQAPLPLMAVQPQIKQANSNVSATGQSQPSHSSQPNQSAYLASQSVRPTLPVPTPSQTSQTLQTLQPQQSGQQKDATQLHKPLSTGDGPIQGVAAVPFKVEPGVVATSPSLSSVMAPPRDSIQPPTAVAESTTPNLSSEPSSSITSRKRDEPLIHESPRRDIIDDETSARSILQKLQTAIAEKT